MKTRYIVCILVVLVSGGAGWAESEETEYFAVFMGGMKIGHMIQSRSVADGNVTTCEKVNMTISRLGTPVTIESSECCVETADGKPLSFEATIQQLGITMMKISGTVDKEGKVTVITGEVKSTVDWPSGAVMSEGLRLLQLKKGLKEGLTYTAKMFSPVTTSALDAEIRIGPKQNVDLLGRIVALTAVTSTLNIPEAGKITSTSYVDDECRIQKNIMPVMGINIEMVACAKEFALGENDVFEVIDKMFLTSPVELNDVNTAESITYYLSPTGDANNFTIPSTDYQGVQPGENSGLIVIVKPIIAPAGAKFPYTGNDEAILEALKPTSFVQSDNEKIIELAKEAVGDTKDAAEAVKRIEAFVAEYIENRSLSVGYASAVEVAASRQGDCSEFSVLTAAMCRAVGIPAQVVAGVAYVKEFSGIKSAFGGHAWVQTYVGDKWICIDSSFKGAGRGGYGPGHIALAIGSGEPEGFLRLATTVGMFKIDKIVVNKK